MYCARLQKVSMSSRGLWARLVAYERGCLFPGGAARGGGGGGDGRRDSTANGLPVERVAAGTAGEAWGAALFSLALRAVVRCRCF